MTQEIKDKIEQEAQRKWEEDQATNPTPVNPHAYVYGFKAGAQTILENPQEWNLFTAEQIVEQRNLYRGQVDKIIAEYDDLKSQLSKYKEALERIAEYDFDTKRVSFHTIAKEALKQEDITCPMCGYPLFKHLSKTCCQGCDYVKQQ